MLVLKILATIGFAFIFGFISAMPVGAVQLAVIKKSMSGQYKPAVAMSCGSASSDLIYGIFTIFGLGNFLFNKNFQIGLYSAGIMVIGWIFYRTFKDRHNTGMAHEKNKKRPKKRVAFMQGFTVAVTNPGMIILWIFAYKMFLDLNLFSPVPTYIKVIFIICTCLGLGGYLVIISTLIHFKKDALSAKFMYRTNIILCIVLVVLIAYFSYSLVNLIITPNFNPTEAIPLS